MLNSLGTMVSANLPASCSSNLNGLALNTIRLTCALCDALQYTRSSTAIYLGSLIKGRPCSRIRRSGSLLSSREDTQLWVSPALDMYYVAFKQSAHITTKIIYIMERSEQEWTALNIELQLLSTDL